jgi:acylphosphatase
MFIIHWYYYIKKYMKIHLNISVSGKVQGVFFRASTKSKAEELGLKGIVRNLKDGTVFIEVEGEETVLAEFLKWCWKGSIASKVTKVDSTAGEIKDYSDFTVLH